jgi:hypothetical protein
MSKSRKEPTGSCIRDNVFNNFRFWTINEKTKSTAPSLNIPPIALSQSQYIKITDP